MKYWPIWFAIFGGVLVYVYAQYASEVTWVGAVDENDSSVRAVEGCDVYRPSKSEKNRFLAALSSFGPRLPVRILVQECDSPRGIIARSGPPRYLLYDVEWPWFGEEAGLSIRRSVRCKMYEVIRCHRLGRYARFGSGPTVALSGIVTSEELAALSTYLSSSLESEEAIYSVKATHGSGSNYKRSGYVVFTSKDRIDYRYYLITEDCIDGMERCEMDSKALDVVRN